MDDDRELRKEVATLGTKYAVLEEQMKTMATRSEALKSDVNASLALLREDMAKRDTEAARREARLEQKLAERDTEMARRDTEMARRDTETARRDKDNLRWLIGLWVAAIVVMGVLIRWPGPGAGS